MECCIILNRKPWNYEAYKAAVGSINIDKKKLPKIRLEQMIFLSKYVTCSKLKLIKRQKNTRHALSKDQFWARGTSIFHGDGFKFTVTLGLYSEWGAGCWHCHSKPHWQMTTTLKCWLCFLSSKSRTNVTIGFILPQTQFTILLRPITDGIPGPSVIHWNEKKKIRTYAK